MRIAPQSQNESLGKTPRGVPAPRLRGVVEQRRQKEYRRMLGGDRTHLEMRMRHVGVRELRIPGEETVDPLGVTIIDAGVLQTAAAGRTQRIVGARRAVDLV